MRPYRGYPRNGCGNVLELFGNSEELTKSENKLELTIMRISSLWSEEIYK